MYIKPDAWDLEAWRLAKEAYKKDYEIHTPLPDLPWGGFVEEAKKFKEEGLEPREAIEILRKGKRNAVPQA